MLLHLLRDVLHQRFAISCSPALLLPLLAFQFPADFPPILCASFCTGIQLCEFRSAGACSSAEGVLPGSCSDSGLVSAARLGVWLPSKHVHSVRRRNFPLPAAREEPRLRAGRPSAGGPPHLPLRGTKSSGPAGPGQQGYECAPPWLGMSCV